MRKTALGTRTIDPETDDFFRALIEERKALPKDHPHYLLLKIIANALYGIFAELNSSHFGKNRAKDLRVFSGEKRFSQKTVVVERPGRWHFPPAAALITAGGRLMLAVLEHLVEQRHGTYLLMDIGLGTASGARLAAGAQHPRLGRWQAHCLSDVHCYVRSQQSRQVAAQRSNRAAASHGPCQHVAVKRG
jgi:hypothetical protein